MKRLIKFWNRYASDKAEFSNCSTEYEVLPELVDDSASFAELKELAAKHSIALGRTTIEGKSISHSIKTMETKETRGMGFSKPEMMTVYVGFIKLNEHGPLKPVIAVNTPVTAEMADSVVNQCAYGVSDVGENIDGTQTLIKESWNYFHEMRFLGYSLKSFEEVLNIEEQGFSDDTYRCGHCGVIDSRDNGYSNNHRVMNCELIGVNCGCYDELCQSDEAIEEFSNNSNACMEYDTAKKLEKKGKLKLLETFIGGMVDGRGGYIRGEHTREGTPSKVLEEFQAKYPKKVFVFSHDDSGQFQSYFSIWELAGKGKKRAAKK